MGRLMPRGVMLRDAYRRPAEPASPAALSAPSPAFGIPRARLELFYAAPRSVSSRGCKRGDLFNGYAAAPAEGHPSLALGARSGSERSSPWRSSASLSPTLYPPAP